MIINTSLLADGTTMVTVHGEIDVAACDELRTALVDEITRRRPPRLVLDLSHVTFLDSTGLNTLVAVHDGARRRGTSFVVRRPSEFVARQMRVLGVYDVLTTEQ